MRRLACSGSVPSRARADAGPGAPSFTPPCPPPRSIWLSSILNLLAPILSFKLYWFLALVPAFGGYKLWLFAKPFLAQRAAAAQGQANDMIDQHGAGAGESSSKRAEKMKKKQEKLEKAQAGGRGVRR